MKRFVRHISIGAVALLIGMLGLVMVAPASNRALAQGEETTVTTQLEPFSKVQINGGGQATLEFGPESSVTIKGNSLIVDQLDAKVENDTLVLGSPLTSALDVTGLSQLIYTIVTPAISEIHLSGTVDLHVAPMMDQQSLTLGLTTGAEVFIPTISAVTISGKLDLLSTAHLAGSASTLDMSVFNGSTLDAEQLQLGSADLEVKGVSTVTVRVTEALTGTASEGSTVSYLSDSVTPTLTTSTLASLTQLPMTPWQGPVVAPTASPVS